MGLLIENNASAAGWAIDPLYKAGRISLFPRTTDVFSARATTGVLAAVLAVDAPIWGIREAAAPARRIYILKVIGAFTWVVAATAAQQFGFYYERFSVANLAGGVAALVMKHDLSSNNSEAQDVRVSTTAALTTAGVTFEGNKIPFVGWTNPAIGTGVQDVPTLFDWTEGGPVKLAGGEGWSFRNLVVWPAAGTGVFAGRVIWEER